MSSGNFLLNYECWWQILEYLQLRDQIRLRQSGAAIGKIIDEYWQRKFSTLEVRGGRLPDCQEWKVLLGGICATVQVLKLYCLSREHFDVLLLHTYPRTVDFRFSPLESSTITDDDVERLSKAFPNLRTLSPSGRLTGRDFWLFRHLTHLTLSYCRCVHMENLSRLLREVPVKSIDFDTTTDWSFRFGSYFLVLSRLEEIYLNQSEWLELTDYWMRLVSKKQRHDSGVPPEGTIGKEFQMRPRPYTRCSASQEREDPRHAIRADQFFANLKCLTVTEWGMRFFEFAQYFKHKIIKAVDMGNHVPEQLWQLDHLGTLEHLRQVSLYHITIQWTARNLGHLQNLQEICVYGCGIECERYIWNLLRNSTRLERLSIEKCHMGFPVLHVSDDNLATARSSPLTLNFFGNYMKEDGNPVTVVNDCTRSRCEVTSIKTVRRHCLPAEKWVRFYFE